MRRPSAAPPNMTSRPTVASIGIVIAGIMLLATGIAAIFENPDLSIGCFGVALATLFALELLPKVHFPQRAIAFGADAPGAARGFLPSVGAMLLIAGGILLASAIILPDTEGVFWDWRIGLSSTVVGLAVLLQQLDRKRIPAAR
ncbi:hypothetical protein BJ980_001781 [Nocardioides daedukensis]|uniref:Uncharacterized protein n=1 Tax=Nocardioides daedukensis TaxID=634462 RepID=A0A7Y9UNS3_9ACTN|nr:hypothetical protein [Nocardioides daedukensis]NYG58858.1 hypothetical protein [Nocardioides daedukensis]